MTENDNYGCHFVGYFSKEKRPSSQNNVSCILVLPIHMRKGYGQYLIEFSYLLTRVEKKTGSPEKPLSDMGLVSYRKYWRLILCEELIKQKGPISISTISERTGMTPDDIVSALEGLRALVRDPVTKNYALRLDYGFFKQYIDKCNIANNPKIKQECLVWTPYVMGRFGQYEDGPALHNVQPREEAEDEDAPVPEEGVQMDTAAAAAKAQSTSNHTSAAGGDDADPMTPALPAEDSTNGDSPAPGTPLANGSTIAAAGSQLTGTVPTIPPTRYEVFPHIPGMSTTAKRRPGRPFGSRRRTSTPQRVRNLPLSAATAPVSRIQLLPNRSGSGKGSPNGALTPGTISGRRTRSKLGESVVNGINGDSEEGGAVKYLNGRRSGTRSQTGSPRNSRSSKGKGKLLRSLDTQDDEDEDEDAEGEVDDEDMDIDAEGEDDEDIVMADS
jgi:histone acetyltransferase SAS3